MYSSYTIVYCLVNLVYRIIDSVTGMSLYRYEILPNVGWCFSCALYNFSRGTSRSVKLLLSNIGGRVCNGICCLFLDFFYSGPPRPLSYPLTPHLVNLLE